MNEKKREIKQHRTWVVGALLNYVDGTPFCDDTCLTPSTKAEMDAVIATDVAILRMLKSAEDDRTSK